MMNQPHEGITAYSRDQDDLLSLEDAALPRRAMMIALAKHLERAILVGDPAPIVERMGARIRSPQIGDLVVEMGRAAGGRDLDSQVKGFGILIERREEWCVTDAEWEEALRQEREYDPEFSDPRPTDEAWYVLYGPRKEDVCRWTNCRFIAIPIEPRSFDLPLGAPTEAGGIELSRDDLLGNLKDSGFELQSRVSR